MKVLAFIATIVLCIFASVILAASSSSTNGKYYDKNVPKLPLFVGLPFGDFSKSSDAEIKETLYKTFPIIFTNATTFKSGSASFETRLQVEASRYVIFQNALSQRNQPGDARVLIILKESWECKACDWIVPRMVSFLADHGCDAAADYIGDLCASIPVVGPFSVWACKDVLNWACDKIADDVEKHVDSTHIICEDVFRLKC